VSVAVSSESRPRSAAATVRRLAADRSLLILAGLVVFTFVLRFSQIHQSLYGDEVYTYQDIYGKSFRAVLTNVNTGAENSPPLFFLFAYATAKLGDPTVWIRLPSIVLGAATLVCVFLIGQETIGRRAGLVAAALLAVSPFSFYYGVEARPYATMAFFVAASTWFLLRALDTDRRAYWALFVLASAGAAYSHYTSIFVLAVEGSWALWIRRDRIRAPLTACALAALLYTPWIPNLRGKALAVIGSLQPLTPHNVLIDLMRPIAGYPYAPLSAIPTIPGLIVIFVCALAGGACLLRARLGAKVSGLAAAGSARETGRWPHRFWLLVALALATPVGLLLYSMLFTDLWLARGLYASMPAAVLVLAGLLTAIPRPLNVGAVLLVIGVLVLGTVRAASPSWRRPPLRSIASYIDRSATAADPVTVASPYGAPGIMVEFKRYHHVVSSLALFHLTPPGGNAYMVLDDALARGFHTSVEPPAPPGFVIVAHRHYVSQLLDFDVTTYHRLARR
jgi:mannosyltransferase